MARCIAMMLRLTEIVDYYENKIIAIHDELYNKDKVMTSQMLRYSV